MTKQEINTMQTETKLFVLKNNVAYAEKSYERMLEMKDFIEQDIRYMYQTLIEELGEEEAMRLLADNDIDVVNMHKICNKGEETLKWLECWKTLQDIKL